jgi:hypothetical protein
MLAACERLSLAFHRFHPFCYPMSSSKAQFALTELSNLAGAGTVEGAKAAAH